MDVKFINPFLESVTNVLATMAQTESKARKPILKKSTIALGDVTGIIGMSGEQVKGSFAISFSKEVILAIYQRMLMEEAASINSDCIDMVGELTNIATGGAKNLLAEKGYEFELATPVVVSGGGHQIDHMSKGPTILIPFTSDVGDFFIEVSFEAVT
ncbi:MAG: chemotaxis protein CheX [Pseudomonadales bacterium]